ncbi:MAG: TlpA family protein disulfide reductase [Sphingobacterium sp.]|nr:TlpA family protein disulfide reductase [Sphingobacterium sp.]
MKRILLILILVCPLFMVGQQKTSKLFVINGDFKNLTENPSKITVIGTIGGKELQRAEFPVEDGKFEIAIDHPNFDNLILWFEDVEFEGATREPLHVYGKNGDTFTIKGDVKNVSAAQIEGGSTISNEQTKLAMLYVRDVRSEKMNDYEFIKKYPNSIHGADEVYLRSLWMSAETVGSIYNPLTDVVKNSPQGKLLAKRYGVLQSIANGAIAPDFDGDKYLDGSNASLKDLRGKHVLLEFWGSWCGVCREEHPLFKKIYEKYKDKGFEIVSVSQENGDDIEVLRKSWKKAIDMDSIGMWKHALDNETSTGKMKMTEKYGILAFPTLVLIGPDGKIIDRFLPATHNVTKEELGVLDTNDLESRIEAIISGEA